MTPAEDGEAIAFGMTLGVIVSKMRMRKDWTQAQLADRIGVSQSAISKIEAGKNRPDAFHYGKLAETFGMDVRGLDDRVRGAMARAKNAVAAVTQKNDAHSWDEILVLDGLIGIIEFVAAAVIDEDKSKGEV